MITHEISYLPRTALVVPAAEAGPAVRTAAPAARAGLQTPATGLHMQTRCLAEERVQQ